MGTEQAREAGTAAATWQNDFNSVEPARAPPSAGEGLASFARADQGLELRPAYRNALHRPVLPEVDAHSPAVRLGVAPLTGAQLVRVPHEGSQICSYVFDDCRIKDHRTNYQTSNVNAVMDGDLEAFIKAYLMEFGGQ